MYLRTQLKKILEKFSILQSQISTQKGFTIVEFLLYMGLLSILLVAITGIFSTILDASLESRATAGIDQDGRFILARLTHDAQSATSSAAPALGATPSATLQLTGVGTKYTYSLDAPNGDLKLTNNITSTVDNLNSVDASISALTFQRIGNGGNTDTIQAKFTLKSRVQRTGGVYETRDFQTTVGLE